GETVVMQEIFRFEETGEKDGKVLGEFVPGGGRPNCEERMRQYGFNLPATMFISGSSIRGGARRR
ncbi:MAG: CpaF family protein, partial [Anaerolineales bacterium]|nr:CpaF family protein [Anaerolineales bacterium]